MTKKEFVTLMALLMSLAALSIDAMLPALPAIGADLNIQNANSTQQVILYLFLGLSVGQLLYGPLSDTYGRRPMIFIGISIFILGCLISINASDYNWMLVGRFMQGLGISSPRVVTMAIVRDQYSGNAMAKIMSLIMMIFVIVPALAPSLGQLILSFANWRMIFWTFIILALIAFIWFAKRQEETLPPEKRKPFNISQFVYATKIIFSTPVAIGYTIASGLIFGAFIGYLVSSQQIFYDIFELKDEFPMYFGILAVSIGASSFANSRLVEKFGMQKITFISQLGITILSAVFCLYLHFNAGISSFPLFLIFMLATFACIGFLFGNYNSLAMEPLGDIAGSATAVISTVQNLLSLSFGAIISGSFNGDLYPLSYGFLGLSLLSTIVIIIIQKKEQKAS